MSNNAVIRWFRGIREVHPSAFYDPAAVDFPPGTVVGIKTGAPVGQLDLVVDPEWQRRNRVVECDRDGRVIESKPVAIAECAPSSTVAPVLPVGDPTQINLAEPLNATAAPLVTFEVAPTPPISERDAGIVAKLRERGIPLASIAAAVNEATPEQIVECLLDQQAKRLAAEHAAAMENTVRECGAMLAIRSDAMQPIRALQQMLADCAVMSQNAEHAVRIGCGSSVVPNELHSAIDRFINAKLAGEGASADDSDWKLRALAAEKNVKIIDRDNIDMAKQLEETRQEAADQKQAHAEEIDELHAAARCGANDTLLDRVRKLAENSSPSDLRVCREQLDAAERLARDYRDSFERENRLLVQANQELAELRGCNARLAKVFDSAVIHNDGQVGVYFKGIPAIIQLIAIGAIPGSIGALDVSIEGVE